MSSLLIIKDTTISIIYLLSIFISCISIASYKLNVLFKMISLSLLISCLTLLMLNGALYAELIMLLLIYLIGLLSEIKEVKIYEL